MDEMTRLNKGWEEHTKLYRRSLSEWQNEVHKLAVEKGWWDGYPHVNGVAKLTTDEVLAKISLMHAELSEATEEVRVRNAHEVYYSDGGKPEGAPIEIIDAIIRGLDLLGALGVDAEELLAIKHEYNTGRSKRHGGKRA